MSDRIRIRLKAFDHWLVDQTAADIVPLKNQEQVSKGPCHCLQGGNVGLCYVLHMWTKRAENNLSCVRISG